MTERKKPTTVEGKILSVVITGALALLIIGFTLGLLFLGYALIANLAGWVTYGG